MSVVRTTTDAMDLRARQGLNQTALIAADQNAKTTRIRFKIDPADMENPDLSFTARILGTDDGGLTRMSLGGMTWRGAPFPDRLPQDDPKRNGILTLSTWPMRGLQIFVELEINEPIRIGLDVIQDDFDPAPHRLGATYVQAFGTANATGATSLTVPPSGAPTTTNGNDVFVVASRFSFFGTTRISNPTDNKSNTYTESHWGADGDEELQVKISHCHNITGGAGHEITQGFTDSSDCEANAFEYQPVDDSDDEGGNTNASDSFPATSGNVTASADSLVLAAIGKLNQDPNEVTFSAGGFTTRLTSSGTGNNIPNITFGDLTSAGGTEGATWANAGGDDPWVAVIVSFTDSGGGGGAHPVNPLGHPLRGPFGGPIG